MAKQGRKDSPSLTSISSGDESAPRLYKQSSFTSISSDTDISLRKMSRSAPSSLTSISSISRTPKSIHEPVKKKTKKSPGSDASFIHPLTVDMPDNAYARPIICAVQNLRQSNCGSALASHDFRQQLMRELIKTNSISVRSHGSNSLRMTSQQSNHRSTVFSNRTMSVASSTVKIVRDSPSYTGLSWLAFACCFPIGIIALKKSYQVRPLIKKGRLERAAAVSDITRFVACVAIMIGIVIMCTCTAWNLKRSYEAS